jgi:hypothetical protein
MIRVFLTLFTFPMASRPLSKNNTTPKKIKATPIPAKPTPISGKKRKKNEYYDNNACA